MDPPDHRARKVAARVATHDAHEGVDPLEIDLFYLLRHGTSTIPDVVLAHDVYTDEAYRHAFDALMLCRASDTLIADALCCTETMLIPYRHLFFDQSVFKHTLARMRYVDELGLNENDPTERSWKESYRQGLRQGPEYLANKYRVGERPDIDPKRVARVVAADALDRFLSHRGQVLNAKDAQEALKWGKTAVSASVVVIEKGTSKVKDATQELHIALESVDRTQTPEEAGVDVKTVLS